MDKIKIHELISDINSYSECYQKYLEIWRGF
jgi:hypothetical protein